MKNGSVDTTALEASVLDSIEKVTLLPDLSILPRGEAYPATWLVPDVTGNHYTRSWSIDRSGNNVTLSIESRTEAANAVVSTDPFFTEAFL